MARVSKRFGAKPLKVIRPGKYGVTPVKTKAKGVAHGKQLAQMRKVLAEEAAVSVRRDTESSGDGAGS